MPNVTNSIESKIQRLPRGVPFTSRRFLETGRRASVDQALSRLVRGGSIRRLSPGVFVKPKINRFVGEVVPNLREVAEQIAKRSGHRIQIHGAEVARKFGLSTQVPVKPLFLTNGLSRTVKIGNQSIQFKHVEERKLGPEKGAGGEILSLLWYLGKEQLTTELLKQIWEKLGEKERQVFPQLLPYMPGWMSDKVQEFFQDH